MSRERRRALVAAALTLAILHSTHGRATEPCHDALPPLDAKTPHEEAFKAASEHHFAIFSLLTAGRVAMHNGDYATAIAKWQELLAVEGVEPKLAQSLPPMIADAKRKLDEQKKNGGAAVAATLSNPLDEAGEARRIRPTTFTVKGQVQGGGAIGPGGAVVWLKPLDRATPTPNPGRVRIMRQRDKSFFPHVLAVPKGAKVAFVNDDAIHHNVFSLSKSNNFDTGLYEAGGAFIQQFRKPGPVEILCNIHSTMLAYVFVVDSPYYAVATRSGSFAIKNVPPGRYRVEAWHEGSADNTSRTVTVGANTGRVVLTTGSERGPRGPVPDKYGKPRQEHLGY